MGARSLVALGIAGLMGCVTENNFVDDLAADYCTTRWEDCDCATPEVTRTACESSNTRLGSETQAMAQEAGLLFDKDCARRWLERVEPRCDGAFTSASGGCFPGACSVYHGTAGTDEPCTAIGGWSDCAQGLVCGPLDTCHDPCEGQRRGDRCAQGDLLSPCQGDLVCTVDGICGDAPEVGQRCGSACAPGARCLLERDEGTCVARGQAGDACSQTFECGDGYRCIDGRCTAQSPLVCRISLPW